ncbi:winged helix-turn-helix transcriptional regulator, partial [Verminephrobacter sp. Larva24]
MPRNPRATQWTQLFALPEQPALPLQARLRTAVVRAILEEHLRPGALLPSSRELAALLGLSRNTVTSAYLQLIDEGFLQARARSGVFVARDARPLSAAHAEPLRGRNG